jgi:hypothetical protein
MIAGLLDAVVGTLERLAARGESADAVVRSLERRVVECEQRLESSRVAFAGAVGKWLRDMPHTPVPPSDGVVEYLIDDASKYTTLLLAYSGPIRSDPAVGAFCDEEFTYIMPPRLHVNAYETMRVWCGPTTIELHYRLVPAIAYVVVERSTDTAWAIILNGRSLYAPNNALHLTVEPGSVPLVLETLDDTTDGTRLRFSFDARSIEPREFTCQLVNMADSRLSSEYRRVSLQAPLGPDLT